MTDTGVWEDEALDYDKLRAGLSRTALTTAARRRHGGQRHFDGSLKLTHLLTVAELAHRYSNLLFLAEEEWGRRYFREAAWAAGLLHEAVLTGATFEDLIAEADELVARAVAALTPDVRQPQTKRAPLYANQLGLAGPLAQAVKLADLKHDLTLLAAQLDLDPEGEALQELRYRLTEARQAALVLEHLKQGRLKPILNQIRLQARELELRANKKGKQQYV